VSQKYESIAPLFIRQATLEDAEIVLEILNSENNGVDPDQGNYGIDIAKILFKALETLLPHGFLVTMRMLFLLVWETCIQI
jgi:hypothetical protein